MVIDKVIDQSGNGFVIDAIEYFQKFVDYRSFLKKEVSSIIYLEINNINNKLIFLDYVYVLLFLKGKVFVVFRI